MRCRRECRYSSSGCLEDEHVGSQCYQALKGVHEADMEARQHYHCHERSDADNDGNWAMMRMNEMEIGDGEAMKKKLGITPTENRTPKTKIHRRGIKL